MVWRIASWNLDYWRRHPERVAKQSLLDQVGADVIALQEVRGAQARQFAATHAGPTVFSHDLHPGATLRWMGCGLLVNAGAKVHAAGVVASLPKPQRSVWARVALPGQGAVTIVSWHAPNAAGDGREVKMTAFAAISAWLRTAERPLVLCGDFNTWNDPVELTDPDPADPYYEEVAFVGPAPRHGLVDGYREVLGRSGQLQGRSEGPLAVSHVLSSGAGHRFDRIFISPDLSAVDGAYLYAESLEAGSDHALHWIELQEIPEIPG